MFPELKLERDGYAASASKWFGRLKKRLSFTREYVFHSFRHTLSGEMLNNIIPQEITAGVLGHSKQGITYDLYAQPHHPSALVPAIESLSTEHLDNVKPFFYNQSA